MVKVLFVSLCIFGAGLLYLVIIDMVSGRTLPNAVMLLRESYSVLTVTDYVIVILLLALPAVHGGYTIWKARSAAGSGKSKRGSSKPS
ncbi:hypothetical protein ACP26L_11545 [Paenibacillus sp. S-38]|uniref:hypothetical protein n=1 Tax=Paenibacillus sp. S-38 TaxID=3416710 RepID=UPI003CEE6A86